MKWYTPPTEQEVDQLVAEQIQRGQGGRRLQVDARTLKRKAANQQKERERLARLSERENRFEARFARPAASARAREVRERAAPTTPARTRPPGQRVQRAATPRAPARRGRPHSFQHVRG